MLHKCYLSIIVALTGTFLLSSNVTGQQLVLDENGQETELVNLNPNPEGEPWIIGGMGPMDEYIAWVTQLPELAIPEEIKNRELPAKVDNSILPQFRPVFGQRGGSCAQAGGVAYSFTYEINCLRELSSQVKENQYPYGYTYNFVNGGSNSNGSSYADGWDIVKANGVPNIADYGGTLYGGEEGTIWLSGYEAYYNGMFNRVIDHTKIRIDSDEGITEAKQWFYDHANGSKYGGTVCFAANAFPWKEEPLPPESNMAGHTVITDFGTGGGHLMCAAGYNDSICFDLNGNGTFEPNEYGGILMVNSGGANIHTKGKAFIPYELMRTGKFWGNTVYNVRVYKEFKPLLTFKTTITHNERNQIRIKAGISNDTTATKPAKIISWSRAFNYSGGSHPMGGKGFEPTIEIGLDVTPLHEELNGDIARIFLQIDSKGGEGKVDLFSVMNYQGSSPVEIKCPQQNVTIEPGTSSNTVTTYLSVVTNLATPVKQGKTLPTSGFAFECRGSEIHITIPENASDKHVKVALYNVQGKLINTIVNRVMQTGNHTLNFKHYEKGAIVTGIFLIRMESDLFTKTDVISMKLVNK